MSWPQCLTVIIINIYQALTYSFKPEDLTSINVIDILDSLNMQIFTNSSSQIVNFLQHIGCSYADQTASIHNTSFGGIDPRERCMKTLQTFICRFQGDISNIFTSSFKIEFEHNNQFNFKVFCTFQSTKECFMI